jgi:peptidoglycan/xylan/chitin deacetylase (PgdA/CDA1 family)
MDEPSIRLSIKEFERNMLTAGDMLSKFDDSIHWLRPGSGWYNNEMLSVIHKHGYRCVIGSVYPYDPLIGSAWFSTNYILWKISPGDIIVLHDYEARGKRTLKTLETLLPELRQRGIKLVTLTDMTELPKGEKPC